MTEEDFWKEEEKKDKKFMKMFDRDIEEFEKGRQIELIPCSEKCIHNIGNACSINDWHCRLKLDRKEMKLH